MWTYVQGRRIVSIGPSTGRLSGFEPLQGGPQPPVLPLHHSRRGSNASAFDTQCIGLAPRLRPRIRVEATHHLRPEVVLPDVEIHRPHVDCAVPILLRVEREAFHKERVRVLRTLPKYPVRGPDRAVVAPRR